MVVVGLLLSGAVYAWRGGYGEDCLTGTDIETVKKFQRETLSLRDELLTKRLELRHEYNKPEPDTDRITTLRKEIIDLKAGIQSVADKYEVPECGPIGHKKGRGAMRGKFRERQCPPCQ